MNNLPPQPTGTVVSPDRSGAWSAFTSTFLTIFLAELGDKTQLTTLMMTAESHKPWIVFGGAACALVLTSLLGVLIGRWLAKVLQPRTLEIGAGLTLLLIAGSLGWETLRSWQ